MSGKSISRITQGPRVFLLGLLVTQNAVASELSFDWDWMVSSGIAAHRSSVWFEEPQQNQTNSVDVLLDVQVGWQGWTGLFAAKGTDVYSSDAARSFDGELIVQELFWQGSPAWFDNAVDLTVGKVRLDWGVGYGYRPLDIFKPYRRNPVGIQVEEGAGTLMTSYFDEYGEWSLVYTDSSWNSQQGSELEERSEQQGIGIRRYLLAGDTEWQGLAYYDDVRDGVLGGSVVTVLSHAWEIHASMLWQNKYLSYEQGYDFEPVELSDERLDHGYQALVGLNWADTIGQNIIVEYWYDSRSWDKSDWSNAYQRALNLSSYPTSSELALSYAQGLNHANLVAHNIMMHWSLDSSSWSHWEWSKEWLWLGNLEPTFDFLYSPQDGGLIATQWLNYTAYDSGQSSFNVELAARFMTGSKDSVYANLSDKHMILLNLKGKF
ncbi:hypothetical protein J4N42_16265 [Vibrio sp. SCSIO 43135]|uniref:hypothetical protein n=1 Tax=Vibrio sp. SCSIO 43135 TaxID=2819096 RepID=UPI0020752E91|nr:hypothetical protein [Vibrio sp. SCSIO 43135]USD44121.1 hypothetical protein J4N42_16265 [Vibrio sp. SCSIO 43135]